MTRTKAQVPIPNRANSNIEEIEYQRNSGGPTLSPPPLDHDGYKVQPIGCILHPACWTMQQSS